MTGDGLDNDQNRNCMIHVLTTAATTLWQTGKEENTMEAHELRTGYNRALRLAKWPAPQHKMRDRKWPENEHPAQLLRLRPLITQHTCDDLTQCTNVNCLIRRRKNSSWLPRATRSNNARSPVKHTLAASSGAPVRPTTNRSDEWQFETRAAISIAVLCF